ncbi:hypothetical protein TcCL_Unassigned03904 [Trypanosoma cruzi]|nr:hypothetical protein TcCL_Unassigned03904 [Trypanosoma cruzi]
MTVRSWRGQALPQWWALLARCLRRCRQIRAVSTTSLFPRAPPCWNSAEAVPSGNVVVAIPSAPQVQEARDVFPAAAGRSGGGASFSLFLCLYAFATSLMHNTIFR